MANFNNLFNRLFDNDSQQQVNVKPIQLAEDGSIDAAKSLALQNAIQPLGLKDRLFGRELTKDTVTTDPTTGESTMETIRNYRPGLLEDIASGYRENRNTPFSLSNLQDEKKGFAKHLGEGLGSIARFAQSPAGRALLTGAAIGLTGGTGLQALAFGGMAGVGNQVNRMNDNIYRDEIIAQRQQALVNSPEFNNLSQEEKQIALDDIANNVKGIRGYVGQDTFNNLVRSQQIRDNYAWRKLQADQLEAFRQAQLQANKEQRDFNNYIQQQNIEEKRADRANQNYWKGQELGLGYAKLNADKEQKDIKAQQDFIKANKGSLDILEQISNIRSLVKQNPKAIGLAIGNTPGFIANRFDTKGVETRTAIDDLRTYIRHELTGAQFSPKEAKEYEKFLPTTKDTPEIINAKLNALENKFKAKIYGQGQKGTVKGTQQVGKYKVTVK